MFSASEPARNEFVDPPPQDQSSATLVLGKERVACRLTAVSLGGFRVVVPRAMIWTGEPLGRLLTNDSAYRVQIVQQETVYDGFLITLQRLSERVDDLPTARRWVVHVSRCCAIGLLLAIGYCLMAAPGGVSHGPAQRVTLQGVINYWLDWSSTPQGAIAKQSFAHNPPSAAEAGDDSEEFETMPAISVAWGQRAGSLSDDSQPAGGSVDRVVLLQAAIDAADSQRSRPANATTLPWLFSMNERMPVFRMAGTAAEDLKLFEAGLKSLPAVSASDAVRSLHGALLAMSTAPHRTAVVAGLPHVKMIHSDDAEAFFRVVDGEIELLRILPIEIEEGTPRKPRSATTAPIRTQH